mgnify:CR=1 FL=1
MPGFSTRRTACGFATRPATGGAGGTNRNRRAHNPSGNTSRYTATSSSQPVSELRALAALGCDEVQGYYLSKPMPEGEVVPWVDLRNSLHASSRALYFEMLTGSPR